jgi:hypothetical protein
MLTCLAWLAAMRVPLQVLAQSDGDDMNPRFKLELYSHDQQPSAAPRVRLEVLQRNLVVAEGDGFLPSWPLRSGDSTQFNVACSPGRAAQCQQVPL